MSASRLALAVGLGFLGLGYGVAVAWLTVSLAGGGHGWGSPLWSGLGILLIPLFGVAVAYQGRPFGRVVLWVVVVGMLLIDALILVTTWNHEPDSLAKAWQHLPVSLLLWAVLWLPWQLAALGMLALEHHLSSASGHQSSAQDRSPVGQRNV